MSLWGHNNGYIDFLKPPVVPGRFLVNSQSPCLAPNGHGWLCLTSELSVKRSKLVRLWFTSAHRKCWWFLNLLRASKILGVTGHIVRLSGFVVQMGVDEVGSSQCQFQKLISENKILQLKTLIDYIAFISDIYSVYIYYIIYIQYIHNIYIGSWLL